MTEWLLDSLKGGNDLSNQSCHEMKTNTPSSSQRVQKTSDAAKAQGDGNPGVRFGNKQKSGGVGLPRQSGSSDRRSKTTKRAKDDCRNETKEAAVEAEVKRLRTKLLDLERKMSTRIELVEEENEDYEERLACLEMNHLMNEEAEPGLNEARASNRSEEKPDQASEYADKTTLLRQHDPHQCSAVCTPTQVALRDKLSTSNSHQGENYHCFLMASLLTGLIFNSILPWGLFLFACRAGTR